ncbi:MAG: hypothetical protein ACRC2T_12215 [Thermoguttaceae bacterium]
MNPPILCRVYLQDSTPPIPTQDGITVVSGFLVKVDAPQVFSDPSQLNQIFGISKQFPQQSGNSQKLPNQPPQTEIETFRPKRRRRRSRSRKSVEPVEPVPSGDVSKQKKPSWLAFDVANRRFLWSTGSAKVGQKTFRLVKLLWESPGRKATFEEIENTVFGVDGSVKSPFVSQETVKKLVKRTNFKFFEKNLKISICPFVHPQTLENTGLKMVWTK